MGGIFSRRRPNAAQSLRMKVLVSRLTWNDSVEITKRFGIKSQAASKGASRRSETPENDGQSKTVRDSSGRRTGQSWRIK